MLRRSLTTLHATALVAGIIIGASIFVQPSVMTGLVPSVRGVLAVWAAAGALTLCGALIAAELASAFPLAGGVYVFLREAYSPAMGFLWGWAMYWSMHTGILAAIAMIFASYLGWFVPLGGAGLRLAAIGAIVVLSAINILGVRPGSLVQTGLTIGKVAAIGAIIAVAYAVGPRVPIPPPAAIVVSATPARAYALALVAGLFAFGGWHMVTYAAEETAEPERTIPRALIAGTILVTVCYMALNAAYFHVLPVARVIASPHVAADAADAVLGGGGAAIMAALVVVSTLGALAGVVLAGPRVYLAMARDGLLFGWLGQLHPRFRTPHRALLLQAAWAVVLVSTGTYRALFSRVVLTEWLFFTLMAVGVVVLHRRPGYAPAYRLRWHPAIPLVFAAAALYIVATQLAARPGEGVTGLLLVGAGWPVYHLWLRKRDPSTSVANNAD